MNVYSALRRERAISTVVDVALALMLISGAVMLVSALPHEQPEPAHERTQTVETLSASTVNFTYAVDSGTTPVASERKPEQAADENENRFHAFDGSLARGLAIAAVKNSTATKKSAWTAQPTDGNQSFIDGLQTALKDTELLQKSERQIHAVWEPFDGSELFGTVTIGESPPTTAETTTSQLTVSSGLSTPSNELRDQTLNESPNFEQVSHSLATVVVEGILEPKQTQRQLTTSGAERDIAIDRIHALVGVIDDVEPTDEIVQKQLSSAEITASTNNSTDGKPLAALFVEALANQFENELQSKYSTPEKALESISVDEVSIVLTEWDQ